MALQQDGQDFALYPKQSRQGFKPPAAHLWPKYWSTSPPNGHKASTSSPRGGGVLGLMFAGYVPLAP